MEEELRLAGLDRESFLQNEVPGMVWREEPRDVLIKPRDVAEVRLEPDELNEGRVRATLQFALPRGAYATMMIKRLFAPSWFTPAEQSRDPEGRDEDES